MVLTRSLGGQTRCHARGLADYYCTFRRHYKVCRTGQVIRIHQSIHGCCGAYTELFSVSLKEESDGDRETEIGGEMTSISRVMLAKSIIKDVRD